MYPIVILQTYGLESHEQNSKGVPV